MDRSFLSKSRDPLPLTSRIWVGGRERSCWFLLWKRGLSTDTAPYGRESPTDSAPRGVASIHMLTMSKLSFKPHFKLELKPTSILLPY